MQKRITINDEEYFKLLELKAKYKTNSLFAILSLVTDNQNGNVVLKDSGQIANMVICPEAKKPMIVELVKPKREFKHSDPIDASPVCQCGHPDLYHSDDGCMGDGGTCACKKYVPSAPG